MLRKPVETTIVLAMRPGWAGAMTRGGAHVSPWSWLCREDHVLARSLLVANAQGPRRHEPSLVRGELGLMVVGRAKPSPENEHISHRNLLHRHFTPAIGNRETLLLSVRSGEAQHRPNAPAEPRKNKPCLIRLRLLIITAILQSE